MLLQNAGLPGVGLGGIFYMIAALAMPLVEVARAARARRAGARYEARWPLALRQAALALGVLGAMWVTGLALASDAAPAAVRDAVAGTTAGGGASPLRLGTLALSGLLLIMVLGAVELARVGMHGRGHDRRRVPRAGPDRRRATPAVTNDSIIPGTSGTPRRRRQDAA